MILTQCAVCATELGLSLGKKCGRCSTRYCGPACQKQHWEEGGHDKLCKLIKKAGGAEQYNANNKYAEAVVVAAEACADDTKGQTCYICTQALHWKTKEGLVRMCSCRGTAGFAHVSCLAEEAKILYDEAEENNLDDKVLTERLRRWDTCSLCEQTYHGVVKCALGWACWKTYVGRPEADIARTMAMNVLGNGLFDGKQFADAASVFETALSMKRRLGASSDSILVAQSNLANTYRQLGRLEEAVCLRRDVYAGWLQLKGEEDIETLQAVSNCADSFLSHRRFEETKLLMRKMMPITRRVLGDENILMLRMKKIYAEAIYVDDCAKLNDLREAVTRLEELERTARRVLGGAHPLTEAVERGLETSRRAFHIRERTGDEGSLREAVDALFLSKYGS